MPRRLAGRSSARLAAQRELVTEPYEELGLDAGHWVLEAHPERVLEAVMAQLRGTDR